MGSRLSRGRQLQQAEGDEQHHEADQHSLHGRRHGRTSYCRGFSGSNVWATQIRRPLSAQLERDGSVRRVPRVLHP